MKDIVNDLKISQLLTDAVRTADATSATLDRQGYNTAALLVSLGNSGDTLSGSVYADVIVKHSDDDSTYVVVEAADIVIPENAPTGLAAPDASGIVYTCNAPTEDTLDLLIGYVGSKRYVQVTIDTTGTHTNGMPSSVHGILGSPQFAPAA